MQNLKTRQKNCHLGTIAQLCRAISLQLRHVSTIGKKNLLSSNISTCPHSMVNFGPLAAEIDPVVWGIPANFNGFRVLATLLHGTPVVGVSQLCGVEQRAPCMFGRATITLGIGPHSSTRCFKPTDSDFIVTSVWLCRTLRSYALLLLLLLLLLFEGKQANH